jgi:hypothetical protein
MMEKHTEKLQELYSSANIIRLKKLRRIRWKGHIAHMRRNLFKI